MPSTTYYSILIIEPNKQLLSPYAYLSGISTPSKTTRLSSIQSALAHLTDNKPDIVFLSASFEIDSILVFLEALKNKSKTSLIPLVLTVDLSQPLCQLPGTTWGNQLGIVSNLTSAPELEATLSRILSTPVNLKAN